MKSILLIALCSAFFSFFTVAEAAWTCVYDPHANPPYNCETYEPQGVIGESISIDGNEGDNFLDDHGVVLGSVSQPPVVPINNEGLEQVQAKRELLLQIFQILSHTDNQYGSQK